MPRIVFVSLFLGLVSGTANIDLRVEPGITSVRLLLGDREVATARPPLWHTTIDFGSDLEPRELTAVGYDELGYEVARASQVLNLPRQLAEAEISVEREAGLPSAVEVTGRHLQFAPPRSAKIAVDRRSLRVTKFRARLPQLDWTQPHVVSAEMRFDDGTIARRELVINGGFSDSTGTELTPVVVTQTGSQVDEKLGGCFSVDGIALRTAAVEKKNALVLVVKDPDARAAVAAMQRLTADPVSAAISVFRRGTYLADDTTEQIMWPVSQTFAQINEGRSVLFEHSNEFDAAKTDLVRLLTIPYEVSRVDELPRQFADAVAVAGVNAMALGRRRAVVYLVSDERDRSAHTPAEVRRYLSAIGVPLFVWSLSGPRPDLASSWGEVEDTSRRDTLRAAIDRLRRTLEAQRVVWLNVDPLRALRVDVKESCGVVTETRRLQQ